MGPAARILLGLTLLLALALPFVALPGFGTPRISDRVRLVDPQLLIVRTGALPVQVGMYIKNLHGLNLAQRTFTAEGYYWMDWDQPVEELLQQTDTPYSNLVEISNLVNEWDAVFDGLHDPPQRLPDGRYRMTVRFSANFYIPILNLRDSPFDSISLPIVLEINPDRFTIEGTPLVLVPETPAGALIGAYSAVDGFHIHSSKMVPLLHSYGTEWGLHRGDLSYSTVNAQVRIDADWVASFINHVLPLLIVLTVVLAAPSLEATLGEIRLAIPTTALLTLIFLQQSYKATLPPLSYLTFLDWLYAYAYLVAMALFVLFLWSNNRCAKASPDRLPAEVARINRADAIFQVLALVGLLFTGLIAWRI